MQDQFSSEFLGAIEHLQFRAEKSLEAKALGKAYRELRKLDFNDLSSIEERAKQYLALCDVLFSAGKISEEEYAFHRRYALEGLVHESRRFNGAYEDVLGPIYEGISKVQSEHGMTDGEYWPSGEGPADYGKLNAEYDLQLDLQLVNVFREFGADDLAELFLRDRAKFETHGIFERKSIFVDSEISLLNELAIGYEREADLAKEGCAYLSASIMLCAAIEARLIMTCLTNDKDARAAVSKLGLTKKVLKSKNPLTWRLETLIEISAQAGWIPDIETERFIFSGKAIAHKLREVRNRVHPHVQLKKKLSLSYDREQFKDIEAAHKIILELIEGQA